MSRDEWLSSTAELVTRSGTLPIQRTDALRKALQSVQKEGAANAEAETRTPVPTTTSSLLPAVFGALDSAAAAAKKTSVVVPQQQAAAAAAVTTINATTSTSTLPLPTRRLL